MQILFLDIDGVLNSWQSEYWQAKRGQMSNVILCPIAVSNLDELMKKTDDLHIVVHSTWKHHHNLVGIRAILTSQGLRYGDRIIDTAEDAPHRFSESPDRLKCCLLWLKKNSKEYDVTNWLIVDDKRVMDSTLPKDKNGEWTKTNKKGEWSETTIKNWKEKCEKHFIQTDSYVGFDFYALQKAIHLLKSESLSICCL